MATPANQMSTTAYDMHRNALNTDDLKSNHEEWNLYTVLNDNINTFRGFTTLLEKLEEDLKKLSSESLEVLTGLDPVRKRPGIDNSVDESIAGHTTKTLDVVRCIDGSWKVTEQPIELTSAASVGTSTCVSTAAATTAKVDTKSPAEQYKIMGQTISTQILKKMPFSGALGTHLSMALHKSKEANTPSQFESIWNRVMAALDALILEAVKMQYKHESLKSLSQEGALVITVLENVIRDAVNTAAFLKIQVRDRETNIPSGDTATTAAKISG